MNTLALIPGMQGLPEILLIAFVIILLFGSTKLPALARSLGQSLNEFKKGQTESLPKKKEEEEDKKLPDDAAGDPSDDKAEKQTAD